MYWTRNRGKGAVTQWIPQGRAPGCSPGPRPWPRRKILNFSCASPPCLGNGVGGNTHLHETQRTGAEHAEQAPTSIGRTRSRDLSPRGPAG